ncbi:hypothetical protein DFH94DRAFT_193572 [Russula ochroleuca]|uniref:Metallothionein n=1 Tax=Russula ochroleuca TaxID=152965 RepID=A0A9P5JZD5_9AGAM|nr:hypothetical protein DFH94DRAFT_193572 [Russula ochroleuca]
MSLRGQDFPKSSDLKRSVRRGHKVILPVGALAKIRINSCLVSCGNVAWRQRGITTTSHDTAPLRKIWNCVASTTQNQIHVHTPVERYIYLDQPDPSIHLPLILNVDIRIRTMSPNPVNEHDGCGSSTCNCGASCACKPGECKC